MKAKAPAALFGPGLWGLVLGGLALVLPLASCDPPGDISGQSATTPLPNCPAVACTGGVHFVSAPDLAIAAAEAPNLTVQLCRNDLCSTLQPTADGAAFSCAFFGPLTAACSLTPSVTGLHLDILFQGVMTGWVDGDVYRIRVGLPSATPLIDKQQAVIYDKSRPDGPDCPALCLSVPTIYI